jgi:hypothetical protein
MSINTHAIVIMIKSKKHAHKKKEIYLCYWGEKWHLDEYHSRVEKQVLIINQKEEKKRLFLPYQRAFVIAFVLKYINYILLIARDIWHEIYRRKKK